MVIYIIRKLYVEIGLQTVSAPSQLENQLLLLQNAGFDFPLDAIEAPWLRGLGSGVDLARKELGLPINVGARPR